jgi:hypothetical protein
MPLPWALQVWVIYSTGDPCIGAYDTVKACRKAVRTPAFGQIRRARDRRYSRYFKA